MSTANAAPPITLNETFSFYVPSSNASLIAVCSELSDAVTVKGPQGPATIRAMRDQGWDRTDHFDEGGYDPKVAAVDTEAWLDDQARAGADRLLSAGTWVPWDPTGDALVRAIDTEMERLRRWSDASALLAIDHRWLTRAPMKLVEALTGLDRPVSLVLAHPAAPLSATSAVDGLITLVSNVSDVAILRTDHGGLGAIVYGAQHAALGLLGTYRHFVPVGQQGGGKLDDRTARVFIREMLDWFTALTIAGWGALSWDLRCDLTCCDGQRLDRFFDERLEHEAMVHNRTALAYLAEEILSAPRDERRRAFSAMCSQALTRYGAMGKLSMVTKPKPQLVQWAFA